MNLYEWLDDRKDLLLNIQYYLNTFTVSVVHLDEIIVFKKNEKEFMKFQNSNLIYTLKLFIEAISESEFKLKHYGGDIEIIKVPKLTPYTVW